MKNKRNLLAMVLAMVMVLAVGCGSPAAASGGGSGSAQAPDAAQVADAMMAAFTPRGEMPVMEESVLDNFYTFDKELLPSYKIYASTTYTAEEIAVFATLGQDAVDAAKKALETRLADIKASFEDYLPEELQVLEDNARILEGNGVICLLVGDADNVQKAEKIFNEMS